MNGTATTPSARIRLGSFELDLRSGELRPLDEGQGSERVLLREQSFVILRMLVERAGKPVTRGEIQRALWPNGTIVEFDHSINVAVRMLRRALGDSAVNPRYVETLGRRGYRLIPPVEWLRTGPVASGGRAPALPLEGSPRGNGDLVGAKINHYRLLEVLGGGGMGMVYKAEDLKLGRHVALKFLPDELAADPVALLRLEREARTASALNHPNICTIFGIEEHEGRPFIVMELLEGETLSERITASAPRPPHEIVDVAIQVCNGLQAAHEKDIVHRDIKPANVFVTRLGPVKLLDFGIAKVVTTGDGDHGQLDGSFAGDARPGAAPELTGAGAAMGTTGYMSPEQLGRKPLDARSDLFSLGLVLYEMATGRRARPDETPTGDEPGVGSSPLRLQALTPAVPRGLDVVIARALQEDPERRYQTAAEMRRSLERVRERTGRFQTRRLRVLTAGVLLLVLVVGGVWRWRSRVRPTVTLAPSDTILVAHPINKTTDRVFDDALFNALRVALEQTPYLNVLQEPKLRSVLTPMKLGETARITPEIALDVCRRTESKVMVAPSITEAGNRLRVALDATDCRSGSTIAQVAPPAVSRDAVIRTLGAAATQLRALLGEPPDSVAKFNAPLELATTASPEALELLTFGYRRHLLGRPGEAIPYYERATQVDPNFALAHVALSAAYDAVAQPTLAEGSSRRAFALRDRLTLPTRFHVVSNYYSAVTGEEEKSCAVLTEWVKTFPYDLIARNNFSVCLSNLGDLDQALGQAREAARLLPTPWAYWRWMDQSLVVDRPGEARGVYDEALRRGFDSPRLRISRVALAALVGDDATVRQELERAEGHPDLERAFFPTRSTIEQFHGRFRASLQIAKLAEASSGVDDPEKPVLEQRSMLMQAEAGVQIRPPTSTNPPPAHSRTRILGALLLARAGPALEARDAAEALRRDFPSHTLIQNYVLPILDAAMKLHASDAAGAVEALRPAARYERTTWGPVPNLYSVYLRGLAQLRAGDGRAAAAEFQRILVHPGLVGQWAFGAMTRVQLARAQHLSGDDAAARASYEDFLALWKDADEDLPLYREAREEYRRLRGP